MSEVQNRKPVSSEFLKQLNEVAKKATAEKQYNEEYWNRVRSEMAVIGQIGVTGKRIGLSPRLRDTILKEFNSVSLDLPFKSTAIKEDRTGTMNKVDKLAGDVSGRIKKLGLDKMGYTIKFNKEHSGYGLFRKEQFLVKSSYTDSDTHGISIGQIIVEDIQNVIAEKDKKTVSKIPGLEKPDIGTALRKAKCSREYNTILRNYGLTSLRLRRINTCFELQYKDDKLGLFRTVYRNASVDNVTKYITQVQTKK